MSSSSSKPSTSMDTSKKDTIEDLSETFHGLLQKSSEDLDGSGADTSKVVEDVDDVITKVNDTVKSVKSKTSATLIVDAEMMGTAAEHVIGSTNTMDMGEGDFNLNEWVEAFEAKIASEENEVPINALLKTTEPFVQPTIPQGWTPINGGFELSSDEIPEAKEKKKRPPAQKKDEATAKTEPEKEVVINNADQGVEKELKIVYKKLKKYYKINNNQPLYYFQFVTDPESFGQTGANIFYCSFLVRDGFAKLEVTDNHLMISPLKASHGNAGASTSTGSAECCNQYIFSLSYDDWEAIVRMFNITTAMI